jgi:hypothetical protein
MKEQKQDYIIFISLKIKIICLLFFFTTSCKEDKSQEKAFVMREVARKVAEYRLQREAECRNAALERANILADSIIFAEAKGDSAGIMPRPARPVRPVIKSPLDSTEVQPLLPKNQ